MIKAENYMSRFPIPSGAPCALASLFTSVQHCLEILVHYLVTLSYKPVQYRLNSWMIFSNLRLTIDDFTAYRQVNVFTTICGSLSDSKPEPQHITRHIILSLDYNIHCMAKSFQTFLIFKVSSVYSWGRANIALIVMTLPCCHHSWALAIEREFSDFQRDMIIGRRISSNSVREISILLKIVRSTVNNAIVKWMRQKATATQPRLVRPHKITDRDRRVLKRVVGQNGMLCVRRPTPSIKVCAREETLSIPELLVENSKKLDSYSRAAAHKTNITKIIASRRLKWCKEWRHWTLQQ